MTALDQLDVILLPLPGVVFFPNTVVPLSLHESIHRQMIKESIARNIPIAIYNFKRGERPETLAAQHLGDASCGVGRAIIYEETDDYLKIILRGETRVRLMKLVQNLPYPIYQAKQFFDRVDEEMSTLSSKIHRLTDYLDSWLNHSVHDELERETFSRSIKTSPQVIDYLSMFLIRDNEIRQHLLESNSLGERVRLLDLLLRGPNPDLMNSNVRSAIKDFGRIEETPGLMQ